MIPGILEPFEAEDGPFLFLRFPLLGTRYETLCVFPLFRLRSCVRHVCRVWRPPPPPFPQLD
jgi:hypothetical protein